MWSESGGKSPSFPVIWIDRHRLYRDGEGVTTLVGAYGCPLRCRYCLNPRSWAAGTKITYFTPQELLEEVKIDNLYFLATGGGITFGGGEPLLYTDFIEEFRRICPKEWRINIETCLNIPKENAERAAKLAHQLIIDIKDMDNEIYRSYTEGDNTQVKENLAVVKDIIDSSKVHIRIPFIPDYNDKDAVSRSESQIREMGFTDIEIFKYKLKR